MYLRLKFGKNLNGFKLCDIYNVIRVCKIGTALPAGALMSVNGADAFPSLSIPAMEAINLVAVRLLEHVPVEESEPVLYRVGCVSMQVSG